MKPIHISLDKHLFERLQNYSREAKVSYEVFLNALLNNALKNRGLMRKTFTDVVLIISSQRKPKNEP